MPSQRLSSRIAIVTGASSGIGRAIALEYHREGAFLVCADLRESPRLAEDEIPTHEVIVKDGGKAIFVKVDVGVAAEVEALVRRAVEEFGRLDIMVNNAGIAIEATAPAPIWDYPESAWDKTLEINAKGVFLGCKYATRQMMKQKPLSCGDRGWLVNISSILGLGGKPGNAGYVSSKHSVLGLTKVVALDCAPYRVHCNAICPGYTDTSMTSQEFENQTFRRLVEQQQPFRGLGVPEDIAKAAVFLASEDNTWITGVALPIDGGYTAV